MKNTYELIQVENNKYTLCMNLSMWASLMGNNGFILTNADKHWIVQRSSNTMHLCSGFSSMMEEVVAVKHSFAEAIGYMQEQLKIAGIMELPDIITVLKEGIKSNATITPKLLI